MLETRLLYFYAPTAYATQANHYISLQHLVHFKGYVSILYKNSAITRIMLGTNISQITLEWPWFRSKK